MSGKVRARVPLPKSLVLFVLAIIAISIVHAEPASTPFGQISGPPNSPLNPNNNNNNNNNNNSGNDNNSDTKNSDTTDDSNTSTNNNSNRFGGPNTNPGPGGNHIGNPPNAITNYPPSALPSAPPSTPTTLTSTLSRTAEQHYRSIHGLLAATAFAFLLPLGSILIRVVPSKHTPLIHATTQILAYTLYISAFVLGIYLLTKTHTHPTHTPLLSTPGPNAHPILGLTLLPLLTLQPLLGLLHHRTYKRTQTRTWPSHLHLWLGRTIIPLGIINGGLGLLLANATRAPIVAYAVVAGIMSLLWLLSTFYRRRAKQIPSPDEIPAAKEDLEDLPPPPPPPPVFEPPPVITPSRNAASELPPYTPGPNYGTHMAHILEHQRLREQASGSGGGPQASGSENQKADFDVVPLGPAVSQDDMYRGQVLASADEIFSRRSSRHTMLEEEEEELYRGQV